MLLPPFHRFVIIKVMNVLIFGLGVNGGGYAAAQYFLEHGESVRVTDLNGGEQLKEEVDALTKEGAVCITGIHREEDFRWADVVIKNPSIPPDNPLLKEAKTIRNDMYYLFVSPYFKTVKTIVVTGTKGKTTTCFAIAYALSQLGHTVELCGNMGISAFSVLSSWEKGVKPVPEYLVIEMSSWQIRDTYAALGEAMPSFSVAILTSFYPDHQNCYDTMQQYLEDKLKLFQNGDGAILVPQALVDVVASARHISKHRVKSLDKAPASCPDTLRSATMALCALSFKAKAVCMALSAFPGVPHRSQLVRVLGGTTFINDSAATIAEAVHFTLSHYRTATIHLIAGGTDKNLLPDAMEEDLQQAKSLTLLDGSFTRRKLLPFMQEKGIPFSGPFSTMKEAVASAYNAAREEEKNHPTHPQMVILSPGCASFELFTNEFDRGEQFITEVQALGSFDTGSARQKKTRHKRSGQPANRTSDGVRFDPPRTTS
jgi:UDP-N-acetylmuramoylalanine--D-glutamate ligase